MYHSAEMASRAAAGRYTVYIYMDNARYNVLLINYFVLYSHKFSMELRNFRNF